MTPVPSTSSAEQSATDGEVVLTRRRWDMYFAPAFVMMECFGAYQALSESQPKFLIFPLSLVPIWLMVRLGTPKHGMRDRRILMIPGMPQMLPWFAAILLVTAIAFGFDAWYFDRRFQDPLEHRHFIMTGCIIAAMIVGVGVIEQRTKHAQQEET